MNKFSYWGRVLCICLFSIGSLVVVGQRARFQKKQYNGPATALKIPLKAGPMIGHVDYLSAKFWVETEKIAEVEIRCQEKGNTSGEVFSSGKIKTEGPYSFIAKPEIIDLKQGKTYEATLFIDGQKVELPYPFEFSTQTLYQWGRGRVPDFSVAIGSCTYINEPEVDRPGNSYGNNYQIFEQIHKAKPDMMLWLGDNNYLREVDWNTAHGIYRRYSHSRSQKELQALLARCSHYSIWDDHDFGPNDSDRSFINKKLTEEAFNRYWVNPATNATGKGGITYTFTYNDAQFFMLDDRFFRSPNKDVFSERQQDYLGQDQLNWLLDNLQSRKDTFNTFKIICVGNQVLNPAKVHENYVNYEAEYTQLLNAIAKLKTKGIIFLSGDRHFTALYKKLLPGTQNPIYDLTCSPLTSGPARLAKEETPPAYEEGTFVGERNFGLLKFSGAGRKSRTLTIQIINSEGVLKWEKAIPASEIGPN